MSTDYEEYENIRTQLNDISNLSGKKNETLKVKLLNKETNFIENMIMESKLEVIEHFVRKNIESDLEGFDFEHVLHIAFASDQIDVKDFIEKWIEAFGIDNYQHDEFIKIATEYSREDCANIVKILNIKCSLEYIFEQYTKILPDLDSEERTFLQKIIKESDFMKLKQTKNKK